MGKVTRGLLDTSVVIAHTEEHLEAPLPEQAAISVATLAELHYGLLVTSDPTMRNRRIQRLVLVEAMFDPLPLDAEVGRAFATVAHAVKTAGGQPRARIMDLWIAATALAYGLPLYTRNFEDFKLLQDLVELRAI
ncbi:MAG TPA: type II toxin-antitoxin system VapC family toxin [Thermoanaerobaculia bacterium]|nr:type II toxin-antitoxin system VapC family toxin [Thermoanaerobaculia bacterium]